MSLVHCCCTIINVKGLLLAHHSKSLVYQNNGAILKLILTKLQPIGFCSRVMVRHRSV
jgi:hypothetical protein